MLFKYLFLCRTAMSYFRFFFFLVGKLKAKCLTTFVPTSVKKREKTQKKNLYKFQKRHTYASIAFKGEKMSEDIFIYCIPFSKK